MKPLRFARAFNDNLCEQGWQVVGVDNNMRRQFFGEQGSTAASVEALSGQFPNYDHRPLDIRERNGRAN